VRPPPTRLFGSLERGEFSAQDLGPQRFHVRELCVEYLTDRGLRRCGERPVAGCDLGGCDEGLVERVADL